ncbi:hypothetical protein DH2020_026210 [Rehmannia glutinosa]|uniref:Small-subunit processome Utp12 domain-containing protein n=1 Tax=Rehmannia glutinosa TaxID=99300 RepID=A0ABR0VXU0_REHGL
MKVRDENEIVKFSATNGRQETGKMVKAYLRYEAASAFGVIVSVDCNITYDSSGKHLLAAALEKLGVWHIASGYADGAVRIWDGEKGTCETTLNGHRSAVTILQYNKLGSLLASGSKDCDIILWDVIGEAGLFRLRGIVTSSSKDKFLRVWDLETQHCIQIVSGHHSEIWSIDVDPNERYLVSGSADQELRFYSITNDLADRKFGLEKIESDVDNGTASVPNKWEVLKHFGDIQRQSKDRVSTLRFSKSGNLLACQVAGTMVEIFRVLDESESRRKAKRRINRKEKKNLKGKAETTENGNMIVEVEEGGEFLVTVPDVFKPLEIIRAKKKICSMSFCPITPKGSLATLALSLNNNLLEIYSIESTSATKTSSIELQGHRSDVRSVTLSSDNTLLMSTSHSAIKIWNPSAGTCLRTIDSGYGLCGLFVPGNKYAIVGTKSGTLEIIDVGSGTCVEVVEAHGGSVQSIAAKADGFVTGSSDKDVKFWEYQTTQKPGQDYKHLTVSPVRNLKMNDDVVVVAVSPEGKHIAVALLDFTVKVIIQVWCLAVSNRGDFLVTGSHDRSIRRWDRTEEPFFIEEEKSKGKAADFRPNILMLGLSPSDYVLRAVSNVHTNDLEQALLALPFSDSLRVLSYLKDWIVFPDKVELVCRVETVLLQIHHNQLTSTVSARPVLSLLKDILHPRVKECKDTLGFNLAAMDHLKQLMAAKSDAPFRDAKAKLLEIRSRYSQQNDGRMQTKEKRRRKKKQKVDNGHVWS